MHFIIDIEIYNHQIAVIFCGSRKKFFKKAKKLFSKDEIRILENENFSRGKSIIFDSGRVMLWMSKKPSCPESFGTLSHEIFHCACFILWRAGINFSKKSDEAYAYLIGLITEMIYEKLEK